MGEAFEASSVSAATLRALNYSPEVEKFQNLRRGSVASLGDLVAAVGPAYGTVFTRRDCESSHGVELLSQTDMFAMEPRGRVIRRDSMAHPEQHEIRRWQVLLAGAGTLGEHELYGRCVLADGRLLGKYVGPDACALEFRDPGSDINLYAYAFLASRTGTRAVRSTSYGTKLLRFRGDLLRKISIPVPGPAVVKRIAKLVRDASKRREESVAAAAEARAIVGVASGAEAATTSCQSRRARCVAWDGDLRTFCAWNHASAGQALAELKRTWPASLRDVLEADGLFNGPRFARIACESPHGIEFFSQRDIFLARNVPRRICRPAIPEQQLFAPEGSMLAGGHGTLGEGEIFGRVAYVSPKMSQVGLTQDLLRIQVKRAYREVAYAYLSSELGFRLLRTTAVGTKILSMRLDLLASLPFPEVDEAAGNRVQALVRAAHSARSESDSLESEAIRIVEEEVLPQWLA